MPNTPGNTAAFICLMRHGNRQRMCLVRVFYGLCLEVHSLVPDIDDERVFPKPVSVGFGLHSADFFAPAVTAYNQPDATDQDSVAVTVRR